MLGGLGMLGELGGLGMLGELGGLGMLGELLGMLGMLGVLGDCVELLDEQPASANTVALRMKSTAGSRGRLRLPPPCGLRLKKILISRSYALLRCPGVYRSTFRAR